MKSVVRSLRGVANLPSREQLRSAVVRMRGRVVRTLADALPSAVVFQHGPRTDRLVALTFDDGPGPLTLDLLSVLRESCVQATFFVIGENCAGRERELAEVTRQGHDLAGHGWSHTPFTRLSSRALQDELERTGQVLAEAPAASWMVRPPFGRMSPRSLLNTSRFGFTSAMWSFDPLDWTLNESRDVLRAVAPTRLKNGDIILLHEHSPTLEALPDLIASIRSAGFELARVSDLVRR